MLNIEKYKDEIIECANDMEFTYFSDFHPTILGKAMGEVASRYKSEKTDLLDWLCEEYGKEPVLDNVERKYLKAVCKPFRNKVKSVQKLDDDFEQCIFINLDDQSFSLPSFKRRTMYKNMKLDKEYTLEELGITYDE